MTMNIRQEEYIPDIGDSAGLRLVIHPQGAMAFPEDEGVTISPGHFTSVAIKKVKHLLRNMAVAPILRFRQRRQSGSMSGGCRESGRRNF